MSASEKNTGLAHATGHAGGGATSSEEAGGLFEVLDLSVRLLKCRVKILRLLMENRILRLKTRIFLFKCRTTCFRLRQALLENSGEWNFFQYVSDYAHNVLMVRSSVSSPKGRK